MYYELTDGELIYLLVLLREQVRKLRDMNIEPRDSIEQLKKFHRLRPDMELASDPGTFQNPNILPGEQV